MKKINKNREEAYKEHIECLKEKIQNLEKHNENLEGEATKYYNSYLVLLCCMDIEKLAEFISNRNRFRLDDFFEKRKKEAK